MMLVTRPTMIPGIYPLNDETMTVRQLLTEVERQSGFSFAYDNSDIDLSTVVRAKASKEDVLKLRAFLNLAFAFVFSVGSFIQFFQPLNHLVTYNNK